MQIFPRAHDQLDVREVGDEVVVHDTRTARIHVLNRTAGSVLRFCDGGHSIDDLAQVAAGGAQVNPDRVRADVRAIVHEFGRLDLLTASEDADC